MTVVLVVRGRSSLWMLTDRRLSYRGRRPPRDDATKVMELQTMDGSGFFGYAGLGATANNTEPSAWMSAVLRGRAGSLRFQEAVERLATVSTQQLPKHLRATVPVGGMAVHNIIVPAVLQDGGYRLFMIDNVLNRSAQLIGVRCVMPVFKTTKSGNIISPHIVLGGTGGQYLSRNEVELRRLCSMVKRFDRGKLNPVVVADEFARINFLTHQKVADGTVGPRCLIVWKGDEGSLAVKRGYGGGLQYYTGASREFDAPPIPRIAGGIDMKAVIHALMPEFIATGEAAAEIAKSRDELDGPFEFEVDQSVRDKTDRRIAEISSEPNDELR